MSKYLQLIRVKHYIKNFLIFLPMICAKQVTFGNFVRTILAFISFSFMTSFVYIINDLKDIDKDRLHPRKKNRPLPSGKIKVSVAKRIAFFLFVVALIICAIICEGHINSIFMFWMAYVIINILYSLGMKNIVIIDIVLLASGFILRVYYGAAIVNVEVSSWLFLTVLNAALFLVFGKRKKEYINSIETRSVLEGYSEGFLDKFQNLSLSLTLVFYSLWVIEQNIDYLFLTIPLLMTIFMKYSLNVDKDMEGDPITILYGDKMLLTLCVLYSVSMIYLIVI